MESDVTNALTLAKQHVSSLEADCVGKDKEIHELRQQLEVTDLNRVCALACITSGRIQSAPFCVVLVELVRCWNCDPFSCISCGMN